jgi:hypothetical protein
MRPICVKCQRFFKPKKNGFNFTEAYPFGGSEPAKPGSSEPHKWKPYKIWAGDLYECQGCGVQIVSGFGALPIREKHHEDFEHVRRGIHADQFQVNDC